MSWEEYDLLGDLEDDNPDDYDFSNFFDEKIIEEDPDYLFLEEFDFSNMEGNNLKKDLKKIKKKSIGRKITSKNNIQLNNKKQKKDVKIKSIHTSIESTAGFSKEGLKQLKDVDNFILSDSKENSSIKNIGYYKGEKLKELVLIINNNTPNDLNLELFNPSQPLDYLFATSQNLNNRISVAGNNLVSYSDVLFHLLANPTLLANAKFTCANPISQAQANAQLNEVLTIKNKNIAGHEKIHPIANNLNIDIDQPNTQIIYWDITETLSRVFIPDGMDIIEYKILAGNQVTFGFYYKQFLLKKFFFKEARNKQII
jgi:hypothetical protein